eukprot:2915354-Pyramimonas_sp.AAC.1
MEATYHFRRWVEDVTMWSLGSDAPAHKQARRVVLSLAGTARAMAQELSQDYLTDGAVIELWDGIGLQNVSGLGFLIHRLSKGHY